MLKGVWRFFTAVFLLALFLGSKGIEIHALSHVQDGDQVSCEWCDNALIIQSTPFEPASVFSVDFVPQSLSQNQIVTTYLSIVQESSAWEPLFGRPPPTI